MTIGGRGPVALPVRSFVPAGAHELSVTRASGELVDEEEEESTSAEADRTSALATLRWNVEDATPTVTGGRRVLFDTCHFDVAADIEPSDRIYAVESRDEGGRIIVRSRSYAPGIR